MSSGDARAPDGNAPPSSAPYAAYSAWSPSQAAGITLLIVAASMAAGLAVTVALAGSREGSTAPRDAAVVLGLATSQLVMIGGALWAAYHRDGAALPVLSLRAPVQGPRAYPMAMVILIGLLSGLSAILAGLFGHDLTADLQSFTGLIRGAWGLPALIVIGIGAPLSEELLFRGFLQGALWRSRLGFWGAAAVATAIWTVMHAGYTVLGLAEVFLIGMIFNALLRQTGSLRVPIFCHAAYNSALALGVRYLPPSLIGF